MKRLLGVVLVLAFWAAPAAWAFTPNDPYFDYQWNFQQIGMETAWDYNLGGRSDITVAVLDTGVDWYLSDLSGTRFDYLNAYDFVNNDSQPLDDHGHGSHVTGTIAQTTDNETGVAGIAFNTTILPLKILDQDGVDSEGYMAEAINYAIDHGADIINISAGGWNWSDALIDACNRALNNGVLIVAAAGNDGEAMADTPAIYDSVLAVGAVDMDYNLAPYSNHISNMIVAPGGDTSQDANGDGYVDGILQQTIDGDYWFYQGTSMATPHVAGVAALIEAELLDNGYRLSDNASGTQWLANVLAYSALDLGEAGTDDIYGYGLLQADRALALTDDIIASLQVGSASSLGSPSEEFLSSFSYSEAQTAQLSALYDPQVFAK